MLEKLLESLRERPSSATVFNQYEDDNTLNNLRQFLDYLLKHRHGVLLLGEAPGYRGCRLTLEYLSQVDQLLENPCTRFSGRSAARSS